MLPPSNRPLKSLALVALLVGPATVPVWGQASFTDQTGSANLLFKHVPSPVHHAGPMDGGGAVGDFNNDGWPDLFVVGGGNTTDKLFINLGNGTFEERGNDWGLTDFYRGCGASVGDFNNDGWVDVYVTSTGPNSGPLSSGFHRLYRNNGGSSFTDIAVQAGVHDTGPEPDGFGSTFGDYDLDGDLDLFVCGWVKESGANRLFQNNGDQTFTDVTVAAGVYDLDMRGFSPRFVDTDGDRYPELLVAADFGTSRYFLNNRDGTFTNWTEESGTGKDRNGMGSAILDFNNDGRIDWYVTAIWWDDHPLGINGGNRLYRNKGGHEFKDKPREAGVNNGGWGWGTTAFDVDHDGYTDILETNGWREAPFEWIDENCYLFYNLGNGNFTDIALTSGIDNRKQGRGLVHMDYDRDGDMDLIIFSNHSELMLCRNEQVSSDHHWLKIKLDTSQHAGLPPNGRQTKITLEADGHFQSTYVDGGCTYLSQSETTAHFGVGTSTTIDEVRIHWADGFQTVLEDVAVDQEMTITVEEPLEVDPLVRGTVADLTVRGCVPNEFVTFLYSPTGAGVGLCKEVLLGGRCLGLLEPVMLLGGQSADAQGTATLPVFIPDTAPLVSLAFQAIIPRGLNGAESALTNAVTAAILP